MGKKLSRNGSQTKQWVEQKTGGLFLKPIILDQKGKQKDAVDKTLQSLIKGSPEL